jgi:hypothetical protein
LYRHVSHPFPGENRALAPFMAQSDDKPPGARCQQFHLTRALIHAGEFVNWYLRTEVLPDCSSGLTALRLSVQPNASGTAGLGSTPSNCESSAIWGTAAMALKHSGGRLVTRFGHLQLGSVATMSGTNSGIGRVPSARETAQVKFPSQSR